MRRPHWPLDGSSTMLLIAIIIAWAQLFVAYYLRPSVEIVPVSAMSHAINTTMISQSFTSFLPAAEFLAAFITVIGGVYGAAKFFTSRRSNRPGPVPDLNGGPYRPF